MEGALDLLLRVVFLAFGLGEAVVPEAEALLGGGRGVRVVEGVDPGPVQGVARGPQGVDDEPVREGVLDCYVILVEERVAQAEAVGDLHRVAGEDPRRGVLRNLVSKSEEVEVVVRKVDGVPADQRGLFRGVRGNRVPFQGVQADLPKEPHPGIGPDRPGGFHSDRPEDRQGGDDRRHEYFRPQILHTTCKYRNNFRMPSF